MESPFERLRELGLALPSAPPALAAYVPSLLVPLGGERGLLHVAGQIPTRDGALPFKGRVPDQVSLEEAREAARLCALNLLAQIQAAAGLVAVEQVLQLTGFVLSADGFGDQPLVLNAASELIASVLGEAGRHTRVAVGANALPLSVPVEIAATVLVRTGVPI